MSEGYIQKGIEAISESLQPKANVALEARYLEVNTTNNVPGSATDVVSLGDQQIRKISPYEVPEAISVAPSHYSVSGSGVSSPTPFGQIFERLSSMFGSPEPLKSQSLVSFSGRENVAPSGLETGETSKTAQAMIEFKEAQKVSVGFGLLSALTQSVLSSVKRLTQGQ